MIGKDKYLHFTYCASISAFVMLIFFLINSPLLYASLAALFTAMGTGLGKEYGDKVNPYNKWDWKDVAADGIGAVFGMIIGLILFII